MWIHDIKINTEWKYEEIEIRLCKGGGQMKEDLSAEHKVQKTIIDKAII